MSRLLQSARIQYRRKICPDKSYVSFFVKSSYSSPKPLNLGLPGVPCSNPLSLHGCILKNNISRLQKPEVQKFEVLLPYFIALVVSLVFTFSTRIQGYLGVLVINNMSYALTFLVQKIGVSNMAYPEGLD